VSTSLRKALRWLLVIPAVLVVAIVGFVIWGLTPLGPEPKALAALESDSLVTVELADEGWVFTPTSGEATRGLVFYPGGRVDVRSYAPYARAVAEQGFVVVMSPMPLSLAVLDANAADRAIDLHPEVTSWALSGHSLGGAMIAQYAAENLDTIDGLVLLAAYPPDTANLARSGLTVTSLLGTQDTVINRENLRAARPLLPADTTYLDITGGNHAQFGNYGEQPGDTSNPDMSTAEQQAIAVSETVRVLQNGTGR